MSMLLRPLVCWTTALLQSSGTPCDVTASLSPSLISRCEHSPLTAHLIHNYLYLSRKLLSLSSCITSSFELVINGFFYVIFCYLAYTALLSWSFLSINNIGYFYRCLYSAIFAVVRCPCACHVSVEMTKLTIKLFSSSGSPIIVSFPQETWLWNSDGITPQHGRQREVGFQKFGTRGR